MEWTNLIEGDALENTFCKISAVLYRDQWVKNGILPTLPLGWWDVKCDLQQCCWIVVPNFKAVWWILLIPSWAFQHHSDVIMGTMASQITASSLFTQPFNQAQIKENIKALRHWPFLRGRSPVNSLHKCPVTRKMFPFDDVVVDFGRSHDWPFCNLVIKGHDPQYFANCIPEDSVTNTG